MPSTIFVNIPVNDLERSKAFFQSLGFTLDEKFMDETAACIIIDQHICVMLITHDKFRTFTPKAICDATQSTETMIAITRESRQAVDKLVGQAVAAGGRTFRDPQDHGFMYEHAFEDPDGHIWEVLWLNPEHVHEPARAQSK